MVKASEAADVGLLELRSTARDLRIAIDGLGRTLDKFTDPRSAILGPGDGQLGPGERAADDLASSPRHRPADVG